MYDKKSIENSFMTSFLINSQLKEGSHVSNLLKISLSNGIQSSYAAISLFYQNFGWFFRFCLPQTETQNAIDNFQKGI